MSPRARLILAAVLAVVVWVAFFFLFIRPRQNELAEVRDQVSAEEARTATLQAELTRLQDLQARAPELEAELARIRQLVPRDHEVPNFIFLVQDAANAAGVDFVSIAPSLPQTPPEGAALAEISSSITAGGSYFAVQDFIRRLHNLDRAVRLDNITLSGTEDEETGVVELSFTTQARMFFELPAAPAAATTPGASPSPSG